jgi:lysophospholipase L1-like esterase
MEGPATVRAVGAERMYYVKLALCIGLSCMAIHYAINKLLGTASVPAKIVCGGTVNSPSDLIIGMYGDSTMEGESCIHGSCVYPQDNAPNTLQKLLPKARIVNQGLSGDNASSWLDRDGATIPPCDWEAEMRASQAQVIVLNWGINDTFQLTENRFRRSMEKLIETALRAGKTVMLETPNPVDPSINKRVAAKLPALVAIDRELSLKYNLLLIDEYQACSNSGSWFSLLSDGIHPTVEGYKFKAQVEFNQIALNQIAPLSGSDGGRCTHRAH